MFIETITAEDREKLFEIRASSWAKKLTPEQFAERNRRLYAHPFARNMTTYVLRDNQSSVLTSLDIVDISVGVYRQEEFFEETGFLLASFITAPEYRGKGYGTVLIKNFLEENKSKVGVLFSDIGPPYYEQFSFSVTPVGNFSIQPQSSSAFHFKSISLKEFQKLFFRRRIEHKVPTGVFLLPTEEHIDWTLERFRYFAEIKGRKFPEDVFWQKESHFLWAVPHFIENTLELLWIEPECKDCHEAAAHLAKRYQLGKAVYWSSHHAQKAESIEYPMVKIPDVLAAPFIDVQLCDWW